MIVSKKGTSDNIHNIAGAGITREMALRYSSEDEHCYCVLGAIASILSEEFINCVSSNVSMITNAAANIFINKKISEYDSKKDYSKAISYLSGEITKLGLCTVRNLAIKYDRLKPIEGIIQMIKYCKGEKTSFVMDVTTSELLMTLPISNNKAKRIYLDKIITSTDELSGVSYKNTEKKIIGSYLYYMLKAAGQNVDSNIQFRNCIEFLDLESMVYDFKESYYDNAMMKKKQVFYAKELVNSFGSVPNVHFDVGYLGRVAKKLSYYMPTETGQVATELTGKAIQSYADKDNESFINTCGEAVSYIISHNTKNNDDIKEECRKCIVENQGIEGSTADKIMKSGEDIVQAVSKDNDDNIIKGEI